MQFGELSLSRPQCPGVALEVSAEGFKHADVGRAVFLGDGGNDVACRAEGILDLLDPVFVIPTLRADHLHVVGDGVQESFKLAGQDRFVDTLALGQGLEALRVLGNSVIAFGQSGLVGRLVHQGQETHPLALGQGTDLFDNFLLLLFSLLFGQRLFLLCLSGGRFEEHLKDRGK